jgi:hypothetical protein
MTPELEKANQRLLHAAVEWARALLEARRDAVALPGERSWFRRSAPEPRKARPVQGARAELEQAAANPDLPICLLAQRLGLSTFERDTLLLAAAAEVDTGIPSLMGEAQGDPARRHLTFGLAMTLLADPSWDALSPNRPLRAERLVEVHQSGSAPLLSAPLRIDERIAASIKGLEYLDERLAQMVTPLDDPGALPPSQEAIAEGLRRWLTEPGARGLVQLTGPQSIAKTDVAARAAALGGRRAFAARADALPSGGEELATFERLWSREAKLQPLLLLVQGMEGVEPLAGEEGRPPVRHRLPQMLARLGGACVADVRQPLPDIEAPIVAVGPPTDAERRDLWRKALTAEGKAPDEPLVVRLAGEFKIAASQIAQTAARAGAGAWQDRVRHASAALAGLTRWIEPRAAIGDVKLPALEKAQLERLIAHAQQRSVVQADFGFAEAGDRGLGLAALFHGESGTGKTLAAEAVAKALGVGLAVGDLATLKSKFVGETERNMRRVFDAAEEGGAVLFFDEADALFGKRSEVKDSHDRYANIEINYLLMRMEAFRGVAILATNQKHALDPAFLRRLRFVVGFPFPGAADRKAIWQHIFPRQTPVGDLDFDRLARFQLSGGSIFNAALSAAHAAAATDHRVDMADVLDAIRWELRKLERPVAEPEFRDLTKVPA